MINEAIIMGRITKQPETRYTGSGKAVINFTVAVENGYGENKQTDFIGCIAWEKTAEFISKYFSKGMMIIVVGRISTRSWEGQDGKKNYSTEVVANKVNFGETKKQQTSGNTYQPQRSQQVQQVQQDKTEFAELDDLDDDLPF